MSYAFAEHLREPGITVNVAYPGHAYTAMNKNLTIGAYPPAASAVAEAFDAGSLRRAGGRQGRRLPAFASPPTQAAAHGVYFNSKARRAPRPASVRNRRNRDAISALCRKLSQIDG
ncbi:Rossmann-fold NAD(P)-binding domain-containing protein [Saccharopolyspora pogona]|uniref:hypothetical protein n=1 Tax=Saccharopolyspora pogona TaxID=333966 RepID=UPI001CC2325E|nr:hypothetical protein [Saccharopolyspora pogona]